MSVFYVVWYLLVFLCYLMHTDKQPSWTDLHAGLISYQQILPMSTPHHRFASIISCHTNVIVYVDLQYVYMYMYLQEIVLLLSILGNNIP